MSHAEYAPKRLPVLTRLAMALRQIPAVGFALARFKTLLRGRTNEEPVVTSELLPTATDVATDAIASEPVGSDTAAGDASETAAPTIGLGGSETLGIDAGETAPVEIETVADEAGEMIVEAAEITPLETASDDLPAEEIDVAEGDAPAGVDEIAAIGAPEIAAEAVEIETDADDAGGTILDTEEFAHVAMQSDDLPEEETSVAEGDTPTAVDEIEAAEAPSIAAEPVEIAAAEPGVATIDTIEAPALGADDIASPGAPSDNRTEPEPQSVAATAEAAKPDEPSDREALIRRRWKETGIMMWRGAGQSTLCIQGGAKLLPPKPGETMPQYDRLEFRLIDGLIVCEGVVVEVPAPLKNPLARAA